MTSLSQRKAGRACQAQFLSLSVTLKKSCGVKSVEEYNEQEVARVAWAFLRSNSTCTLRFGENMQDMSYVIAPSGELVISAMVAMLQPCDTIMYVPDYVINAGGLMNVANELQGYNKEKAKYQVEGIYYILTRIFDYAANNNISTLEAANLLAERRIQDYIKWNHQ